MEPKFKNLIFDSQDLFDEWLKNSTFRILELEEKGQDMQRIWIHESGEILHCDFHSEIYAGRFVDTKSISAGNYVRLWEEELGSFMEYRGLLIEKATIVEFKMKVK